MADLIIERFKQIQSMSSGDQPIGGRHLESILRRVGLPRPDRPSHRPVTRGRQHRDL
jgi:hypothetical protein